MVKKKVARLVSLVGGVAAMLWLMRDRLISLAATREPEPPQFRTGQGRPTNLRPAPSPAHAPAPEAEPQDSGDDLQEIRGIGPVYEQALRAYGVRSFERLAEVDAADLAEHLGVPVGKVADWAQQAKARLGRS